MLTCTLCGNSYINRKALSNHVTRSEQFDSPEKAERYIVDLIYSKDVVDLNIQKYIAEELCADDLKKNIDIVKYLELTNLKRTSKEERKTKRYKQKIISAVQKKHGNQYTNFSQVPSVKKKVTETIVQKYGDLNEYYKFCRKNMRIGYDEYAKNPVKREKQLSKTIATCVSRYGVENPIKYVGTDLIMGKLKVSDVWEKDKRKLDKAISCNYKVLYIWECDIKNKNEKDLTCYVKQLLKELQNENFVNSTNSKYIKAL